MASRVRGSSPDDGTAHDCETDVFLLDRDDFCKLASNGLKPMEGKKLEPWCNTVRARTENCLDRGGRGGLGEGVGRLVLV